MQSAKKAKFVVICPAVEALTKPIVEDRYSVWVRECIAVSVISYVTASPFHIFRPSCFHCWTPPHSFLFRNIERMVFTYLSSMTALFVTKWDVREWLTRE